MQRYHTFLSEKLGQPVSDDLPFSKLNDKLAGQTHDLEKLATLQAEYLGLPLAPKLDVLPWDLVSEMSLGHIKRFLFVPFATKGKTLHIALAAPEKALPFIDDIAKKTPVKLHYMPAPQLLKLVHDTWEKHGINAADVVDGLEGQQDDTLETLALSDDLLDNNDDAPIIKLINTIITQAMKEKASDIHIEPFEKTVKVRFRTDGVMHTVVEPSAKMHAAMSARLKVMAGLDIAEKRLPQDGRFKIKLGGKETDVRMSTLPTQHGERVVLRLLGQQDGIRPLSAIGMRPKQLETVQQALALSNGMIFICGPTGSGKTSTLYAGLKHINNPDKNIVTVEDPVEYELPGIGQIPVNKKIGMTFAAGLRSILRQDPDIVVVGETRDLETANIAIESSLTGHLVLSTIHTNDAPSTVTRLIEMGIEPFLASSSLRLVIAQRMIRLLHPTAKVARKLDAETKKIFDDLPDWARPEKITLFDAAPNEDSPTGYRGRSGIFEIMTITDTLRTAITSGADDGKLRKIANAEGMLTLYQEGLLRAAKGETTLAEIFRVTRTHT